MRSGLFCIPNVQEGVNKLPRSVRPTWCQHQQFTWKTNQKEPIDLRTKILNQLADNYMESTEGQQDPKVKPLGFLFNQAVTIE